jgi:hypothetical protein
MALQHLRASTADKRPTPGSMSDGQVAMNTNLASPGLFFKDSNGDLVKVGPVHVGTTAPNATPASGGQAGNSKGEQWLDTSSSRYVFKIWDGTAWRTEDGEFVNTSGDTMTGALGIIAGTATAPGVFFTGDPNTGIYSPAADQVAISTNAVERVEFGTSEVVFNDGGANYNFRIEGDTATNLFFVDASTDRVGLGTSSPTQILELESATGARIAFTDTGTRRWSIGTPAGGSTGWSIYDESGAYEALRIDIAGNVGIGTTSPGSALEINAAAATSPFIAKINTAEAARIDSSGRLLVGTSTTAANNATVQIRADSGDPLALLRSSNTTVPPLIYFNKSRGDVSSPAVVAAEDRLGGLVFAGYSGAAASYVEGARIQAFVDGEPDTAGDTTDMPGRLVFSTTADGASTPTEQMRIDNAGNVGIGTTSPLSPLHVTGLTRLNTSQAAVTATTSAISSTSATSNAGNVSLESVSISTATRHHISFVNPNGVVGSITTNASATAYVTSSDYRLKENVVPLTGAIDRLQQIPVHRFNFIADPDTVVDGFIAHEAQEVVPECVTGTKDEVDENGNPAYQGIDQSKLVPLLTAALQEAITEIASLKDRVATLEAS